MQSEETELGQNNWIRGTIIHRSASRNFSQSVPDIGRSIGFPSTFQISYSDRRGPLASDFQIRSVCKYQLQIASSGQRRLRLQTFESDRKCKYRLQTTNSDPGCFRLQTVESGRKRPTGIRFPIRNGGTSDLQTIQSDRSCNFRLQITNSESGMAPTSDNPIRSELQVPTSDFCFRSRSLPTSDI